MSFESETRKVGDTFSLPAFDHFINEFDPAPAKRRRGRKTHASGEKVKLAVCESFPQETLAELAERSHRYAMWVRVVMLRLMIRTPALGRLKGRASYNLTKTCEFLGFENFEEYGEHRSLSEIRKELEQVLTQWELQVGDRPMFPVALQANLNALAEITGLNEQEQSLLGLAVVVHAENIMENCIELLGSELAGYSVERILAPMLGAKPDDIATCLAGSEKLASTGLLTIDMGGRFNLRQLMDLMTGTFASRMMMPQTDIRKVVEGFVRPVSRSDLTSRDYVHIQSDLEICKALLKSAVEQQTKGVNILIYGSPGSGKTMFSRLLATELNVQLMEISASNLAGAPVAPTRRVRNYRIAQSFFKNSPTVILFDECEEILNQRNSLESPDEETPVPRKSWFNQVLENNVVPAIWVANSIRHFDEAYLRRFSICFEMPMPSLDQREKMLARACNEVISAHAQASIARNESASPAMLMQTARVVHAIAQSRDSSERDALAIHIINNSLKAQHKAQVSTPHELGMTGQAFNPAWINSDVDLTALSNALMTSRSARLCLWGPPGTGKTAFGKWLASRLDAPHRVVKASDLLSPFLGETEKHLAQAFESARQQKAVLQLDEVDSFLQDRGKANKQWEVTQVNEMLTQMEKFSGVFIASTNLFQNLDEASLRRFDMAIQFGYLKADAAWDMFLMTCDILGVAADQAACKEQIMGIPHLTPGDFEQVTRRARLLPPTSAAQVIRSLQSAVSLKKSCSVRPIGFLTVA